MKRFTTIFLLITLFFVITSSVLAQTITIGTGTSTQRYPLDVWYGYGRSAAIYTAAEVTLAGTITKLAWYPTASISVDHPIKIYLKEVTTSTLVADTWASMISGATMVYDATISGTTANIWNEFSLSTSFGYNGTDNLLVLVETNYGGTGSGTGSTGSAVRYSTATSQHQYWQTDNAPSTSNGTVTSNRPNIQITLVTGPMVYTSSTTTQNTIPVMRGTNDQWIIGIQVVTTGTQSPISLTQFNLNTNGTTNTTDISNAKIYYTGTSNVFAATNQFGSTVASPNGSYNITDTRTLSVGTNYFWLTYDIPSGATAGNFVDAECVQITVDGSTYVPTITSPSGNREIKVPLSGTYIIGPGGYTSFGAAVADLNLVGISGPVTFNVTAGQVFTDSIIITATGTASNTITFQKSGGGANPIIQRSGTTATTDAIIMLNGSDYITFDGIDLQPVSGSTAVERGYYLVGASATNGCKNNTIKNCVITLDKANTSSRGIFLSSSATDTSGANTNNKFYNNTVQNCYNGYYLSGNSSVYDDGNEIGITGGGTSLIDNIGGSSSTVYGIYYLYQTGLKIFSTTLSNVSGTLTTVYGIYGSGTNNTVDMYSNTISNISNTSTSSSIYGLYIVSGLTHNFYSNTVRSCTSAANVYGVYISASSSTNNIYKNSVYDLNYSGTSSSYAAYGMYFSSGTSHNIYNNMIYDLRGVGATNTTVGVTGLYLAGGTNVNVFYNSVLLNYVSTSSANRSAAIYASTSPTNIDLRNNIFVNNVDVTTGTHAVAFRRSGTGFTNIVSTTNNNLYYAGTPGTKNLIFYDGTNSDQTLTAYKTRIATRDQSAVTENPPFLSTSTPYNLHLNPSTPTQCERGAVPVTSPFAVADDFDGDSRNASTPDIGADEGSFTMLDISPPSILYTALTNTSSTSNRILTANIVDGSGVPTSGSLVPRIYYKKSSTGTYYSQPGTLTSGSGQNGTWNFTINNTDMGGVTGGDTVYYFVIAQDIVSTPNIGSNPGGVVATDVNNITTYPPLNSYRIIGTISGSFNVGSGQTYETITAAVNDLNNKEIVGAVVFILMDASYPTETYPIKINTNPGSSASNTVIIKPASGVTASVSGSSTTAIFQLNGVKYVTIDGSNNGTNSRDLSILNTSTTSNTCVIWISSLGTGNGASYNAIKNCNIAAGSNSVSSTFGIFVGGQTISTSGSGDDNDNLTIQNNVIKKAYYGMYVVATATGVNDNLNVNLNIIGDDNSTDYIGKYGLYLGYASQARIGQNTIKNIIGTNYSGAGIYTSTGFVNSRIFRNLIHGIKYTGTGGWGMSGIRMSLGTSTANADTIVNNIIYDITADGYSGITSTINPIGILLEGTSSNAGINIYYNSINLYGNTLTAGASVCLSLQSGITGGVDVRNNIFSNSLGKVSGTPAACGVVAAASSPTVPFSLINYNDYYITSNTTNNIGYIKGAAVTSLAAWQDAGTGTGQDANSLDADPMFFGQTALQPYVGSPVLSAGTPITGVTVDYLGEIRGTPPSIGAYENGIAVGPPNCATIVSPPDTGTNVLVQATLKWANGGGGPTGYKLWFGTDNPPTNIVNGADLGNVLTYDPPGNMTYNTTYYWKIVPYNGMGDASGCAVWSFTTAPDPTIVTFPYTQNFDGVTAPELPYGWSKVVNSSSSYAKVETYTTSSPYSTPNHVYNYNSGDASATLILISPPAATLSNKRIKFMAKGSSGYTLIFGTMSDPTNAATFTDFTTINLTSSYTEYIVEMITYSGSDQYIALKHGLGGTYRSIYIDDFVMDLILENDISAKTIDDPAASSSKPVNVAFSPKATFMNNGTVTQTSIPVRFKILDGSNNLIYMNDQTITSLAPAATQQVTFSNFTPTVAGTYTARAIAMNPGDGNNANDSISVTFYVIPTITTFPYFEDFEGAAAGWRSAILNGTANDWIIGTPAKTHISGPYSGTKCWVTKDTGSYTASQNAYVISPIFNVSALTGDVAVEFYHNFKTENNWDAGVLEYSIDGGAIWRRADSTVGTAPNWNTELSTKWYNNSSTSGPITPRKWADTSSMYQGHLNGWIKSTTVLLGTAGQPNLQLRWRFGCDGSVHKEGWAFDNVTVKEREPFVTVSAPNGGEWLLIGTQQTISWNSFGVTTVDIDYTTNNGTSWISIASGVPSKSNAESMDAVEKVVLKNNTEGTYLWTIPNTPSSDCKVRVTSASNPLLTDMSDNTFTIASVLPPGWAVRANSPDAISRPLAAYAKIDDIGYVYIMGGGTPVTNNRKYNTSTNTWTSGTAMLNGAMTSSAAPVKGIIYAIGGTDTTPNIGKVQIYDPKTDSWSYGTNLPGRQRDIGVAVWRDSLIYVFGGDDGLFPYAPAVSPVTNDVRFYNPSTNTWTTATSLPIAYAKMGAAICGNTIILAGGWTGGDAVANCYKGEINPANPAEITWTAIPNYPAGTIVRVAGAYLSNAGNGVIFTGGLIGGSTPTGNTYFFDITANTWSTLPSMPTARGNMSSRLATNGVDSMWAVCGYSSVALSNNERFSYPSVTTGTTISVNLNAGWNMISNPVTTSSDSVKQLYPTSLFDYVFSFAPGTGYVQSKRMLNGPGYWGKFPAAGSANITGGPRTLDSISVVAGWNMVGTISYQIDTSTITSNPPGLKASNWFGYETGYNPAKFLVPGKAYWIKSNGIGKFVFQGSGELSKPSENISELDQFNSITFTDANGSAQTLYFGSEVEGINTAMYEMPPTPPSDAFDARFESIDGGYMLQTHSSDLPKAASFTISIQSMAYPLTITWNVNSDQHAYELSYGDANTKQTLIGEGQLTINDEDISRIVLMAKSGEELPAEFALMQNYPNPFNPVTNIKLALPEPSKVTLEIYNVLGQKVRTLISEERVAGYHVIEWNGKNDVNQFTGSGVYYLKINADGSSGKNFTQIRKMILLR